MSDLTFPWDAGLAEPVHCTFTDTGDGPCLEAAFVGGVDIYGLFDDKRIQHIEWLAAPHLERQAEQINAERRAERIKEYA